MPYMCVFLREPNLYVRNEIQGTNKSMENSEELDQSVRWGSISASLVPASILDLLGHCWVYNQGRKSLSMQPFSLWLICLCSSVDKIHIRLYLISEKQHLMCSYFDWYLHTWISGFYVLIKAKFSIRIFFLLPHITFSCY